MGYSLVEEGEQVAGHHQRRPRHAQQDLTDALRSLVQVFNPCSKKGAGGGRYEAQPALSIDTALSKK